jgi:hypothetical protein
MSNMEREVEKWREHLTGSPEGELSWTAPFKKLKFKYENNEWQQVENMDIFTDLQSVKNVCGTGFDEIGEITCWLDAYNWSLMKQTPLTEDIYQFIVHHAHVIRAGIDKEIQNFSIDWTQLEGIIPHILDFITILGGLL